MGLRISGSCSNSTTFECVHFERDETKRQEENKPSRAQERALVKRVGLETSLI